MGPDVSSRRQFLRGSLAAAGLGLLAGCGLPSTSTARRYRVGFLAPTVATVIAPNLDAFRQGMRAYGYVEGENLTLETRYSDGRDDRLPDLASDLLRANVDVIVTGGPGIRAARDATGTIPIVFAGSEDPLSEGLIVSLAHPGGNVTGLTTSAGQESTKRLELLKQTVPRLARVGVLSNRSTPRSLQDTEAAARVLGIQTLPLRVESPEDLDGALATAVADRADALIGLSATLFASLAPRIVELAASSHLPAMYVQTVFARQGGLLVYGPNFAANYRRAAYYVDRVLKGIPPGDLPVEQPTTFDFVINLKTAQALGLTVPPDVLAQATEVLQ